MRQGALEDALAAIRSSGTAESIVAQQLEAIFAAEAERVANAAVLAELLRPMLAQPLAAPAPAAAAPLNGSAPPMPAAAPFASPAPAAAAATRDVPRAAPTDIASFIDDMLAQERAAPAPAMRRVS